MRQLLWTLVFSWIWCAGAWAYERDFAENSSVEEDRNRDSEPDGWNASAFKSPAKLEWDKTTAHSGAASLRISDSKHPTGKAWDENTGRWASHPRKEVSPGAKYTLSAWVKTQGVTGRANICIAWWAGDKWLAESYSQGITGTSDWRLLTVSATPPAGATMAAIYLNLSGSAGAVWFDDIHMAKADSLPRDFQCVDLSGACNAGFSDETPGDGQGGWTDQGKNDMRNLPTGDVTFRGIPFHVLDPKQNEGKTCIVLKGKERESFPESAVLPVNRACETLYFLHCCAWGKKGAPAAQYEIVYDDGVSVKVPLRAGYEMPDWWGCRDTQECAVGWEGSNAQSDAIGLGLFPYVNTKPGVRIKEVRFSSLGAAVPILVAITTANGPPVLPDMPIRYDFTDTSRWYPFTFPLDDTNLDTIDLTRLLDGPAGKHGFLTVRDDGHFYFQDGTRARFFGTNICGASAFPEKAKAEMLAARLAKYGVNLLRIHAIDNRWGGLVDYSRGDSRHFKDEVFDRLDYFFAQLKKRGIYVYFDILDYREYTDADGVKDATKFEHGWKNSIKGATIYNDRLIELQKEFAEKFFTHRNPYTNLRYVDDPAVAVVEITNENSVFYFSNTELTLPCYVDELRARWNRWLAEKYGSRDALANAWTNEKGECALQADEDPARSTVILPLKYLYQKPEEAAYSGERSPARVNAMVRFLFEIERRYYGELRAHLAKIGIKVPITGTNQTFCPASNFADACNDFMSRNNYWRHPNVHAKPFFTFQNLALVNSNLPTTDNPITEIASSTAAGKPMIVPEFNFPAPNEFRAECLPLMAAYACLQDWDGLLFFAYSPDRKAIEMFGNQSDPVRWGQFPAAALIFHRRDVSVARNTVHVGCSEADIFAARPSHSRDTSSPFRYLPYLSKVRNAYFPDAYTGDAEVVVASGHSPCGSYASAKRAIIFAKSPWVDPACRQRNRALSASQVAPGVSFVPCGAPLSLTFPAFLWKGRAFELSPDTLVNAASLPQGAMPFGTARDGKTCLGFITDRFCVAPDAPALAAADPAWDYRLFAEAARKWGLLTYNDFAEIEQRYVSDTGQLCLNRGSGIFTIATPRTKAAVGFIGKAGRMDLDGATVDCKTAFAAVMVTSLDGKEIGAARRLLVTAVARAENTGQAFSKNRSIVPEKGREPALAEPVDGELCLNVQGAASVYPLDPTGRRKERIAAQSENGTLRIHLGGAKSPWLEIVVE